MNIFEIAIVVIFETFGITWNQMSVVEGATNGKCIKNIFLQYLLFL